MAGFRYSQIRLYLVPVLKKKINTLKSFLEESDLESLSLSDDDLMQTTALGQEEESVVELSSPGTLPTLRSETDQPTASAPAATSTTITVDCPLCFKRFPINEVEQHADRCSALFGLIKQSDGEVCTDCEISEVELAVEDFKSDACTLLECITKLKDVGLKSEMKTVRVTVRRKMVWEDFKRSRYRYYEPDRRLKVTFAGEPAVDDGGPKREFFAGKLFVHHFRVCYTVLLSVGDTIVETREFPRNIVSSRANTML